MEEERDDHDKKKKMMKKKMMKKEEEEETSPPSKTWKRRRQHSLPAAGAVLPLSRTHHEAGSSEEKSSNLYERIIRFGDPGTPVGHLIDQWVTDGKKVTRSSLMGIIKCLQIRGRYKHALEVSEWMSSKWSGKFSTSDFAVQLGLIGNVRGVESAEAYFDNLNEQDKDDKTYGALLHCYAIYGDVDKSLSLLVKMKELGCASSSLFYNDLMLLYSNAGQQEKVLEIFVEMKKNGISPDNFSYRVRLDSYGEKCDLDDGNRIVEEMESEPEMSMDWLTCSTVAKFYIKAGSEDMALVYLKRCEEKIGKGQAAGYNHLISGYAALGNKDEVMRVWSLAKSKYQQINNRGYIAMLGGLVKLDDLEEASKFLSEWESTCRFYYDFEVPNVLLEGYTQKGQVEKAEALLREMIAKGKTPISRSWGIIAAGYADKSNMEEAYRCFKEALNLGADDVGWRPKTELVTRISDWLGASRLTDEVESFVTQLEAKGLKIGKRVIEGYLNEGEDI